VRRRWTGPALLALVVVLAGCTETVPGTPVAAPSEPTVAEQQPPAPPATSRAGLEADVIADECLLNADEFGSLVGEPVKPPAQGTVKRPDGSTGSSCVATAGTDPVAMINVYKVKAGSPADYVRAPGAAGRHELPELGEAAVVVDTQAGPTLQLATTDFLVTILVAGRAPPDEAWHAAAVAVLTRLPG
jgi:hypothetical protein